MYTKQRKRIGVLICECDVLIQQRMLRGIITQAQELNMDVAVFSSFLNNIQDDSFSRAQYNIFRLANFEELDGIIYARQTIYNEKMKRELDHRLSQMKIPVIVLNDDTTAFQCVMPHDRALFRRLTNHLIEAHGVQDIFCLTGPRGIYSAEERLKGYRDALAEHDIPCDESRIRYGNFWFESGYALGEQIVSGEVARPQAVICGNDPMALALCEVLTQNGISVPDDILIAGYEATNEGRENPIPISSYSNDAFALGVEGARRMYEAITGAPRVEIDVPRGYFSPAKSCSCAPDPEQTAHELRRAKRNREDEMLLRCSMMSERLAACETLDEVAEMLYSLTYMIRDIDSYCLCLCEDWEGSLRTDGTEEYRTEGYSDMIRIKQAVGKSVEHLRDRTFPKEEMFPRLFTLNDGPCAYYFTPLQHNDRIFGYSVLTLHGKGAAYSGIYPRWSAHLCNALEFVRVRNYFKSVQNRVHLAERRDPLTGLYNKLGFETALAQRFAWAREQGKNLLILVANLDNLAAINDHGGRLEGDNAMILFANAISKSFSGNEHCARIAGGNFAVVGCGDYSPDSVSRFTNAISGYLEQNRGEDEKLEVSFGCYCGPANEVNASEELYQIAYANMEEHRKNWRTERNTPYYTEFKKLREQIYSKPQEDWSIDAVCRRMILSRGYFQKLYTRCFGISFTQDVINSRINYSKKLLAETDMIIANIAAQSGYDNYVHFMHQFKKIVGITPTDYRKRKRAG